MNKRKDKNFERNVKRLNKTYSMTPKGICTFEYIAAIAENNGYVSPEDYNEEYEKVFQIYKEVLEKEEGCYFDTNDIKFRALAAVTYCAIFGELYERAKEEMKEAYR